LDPFRQSAKKVPFLSSLRRAKLFDRLGRAPGCAFHRGSLADDGQPFHNPIGYRLPTIRPEYCSPEGTRQDRVEARGLAIQKLDELRDDLVRGFFHEPVAGIANDQAFDIRCNEPALLNEKIAGGFFTR